MYDVCMKNPEIIFEQCENSDMRWCELWVGTQRLKSMSNQIWLGHAICLCRLRHREIWAWHHRSSSIGLLNGLRWSIGTRFHYEFPFYLLYENWGVSFFTLIPHNLIIVLHLLRELEPSIFADLLHINCWIIDYSKVSNSTIRFNRVTRLDQVLSFCSAWWPNPDKLKD